MTFSNFGECHFLYSLNCIKKSLITKAEFDSLKNNFQAQIDSYNNSIDSKIDGAIASYLSGIRLARETEQKSILNKTYSKYRFVYNQTLENTEAPYNGTWACEYFRPGSAGSWSVNLPFGQLTYLNSGANSEHNAKLKGLQDLKQKNV